MRIRAIKPGLAKNEELSSQRPEVHLIAALITMYADDEGYFNANPALVKADCCPLREDSMSVPKILDALSGIGFIRLGTGPDGKRYGHVRKFAEHQRVNRPTPSKIAPLDIAWDDAVSPHEQLTEDSSPEGKGRESKGREGREASVDHEEPAQGDTFITLPSKDGPVSLSESDVVALGKSFPSVNVRQQIRQLKSRIEEKPDRFLKPGAEVPGRIENCLRKEQENPRRNGSAPPASWHPSHREADREPGHRNTMTDDEAQHGLQHVGNLKGALGNG